jgi:tRNA dimethylallyltransferase
MSSTVENDQIKRIFLGFAVEAQKKIAERVYRSKKKVIIISGPTSVGKTALAHELAKEIHGEIISADSMQVYKGMDIGTAKVESKYRDELPYHLLDIQDVSTPYNVVDFYDHVTSAIRDVLKRDAVPIIVGGSGFYIHSLIYGPPSGPPPVPELREKLREEWERLGAETLFERVKKKDPQYASTITHNDKNKILRALEIMAMSGKPVSSHLWKGSKAPKEFNFHCWFLSRPREILYERVEVRCNHMLKEGFLEEVVALEKQGLRNNQTASDAIGYKQALAYLDSEKTVEDYARFIHDFKVASRHYIKRQITWFKREALFRWLDLDMHDPEVARDIIRQEYECAL